MAFPTTITTDGLATHGCAGPFVSSGGNVYLIIIDDQQFDLRAFKATDPSTSFANVGTDVVIGSGSDLIRSVAGWRVGDVIHVATKNSNGSSVVDIRYHVFDMSTDTWTTTNTMVKTDMELADFQPGWSAQIGITVRTDGAIIICYNGAPETVSTVEYDRVYYARNTGGGWSADFALGTAGVAASWIGGQALAAGSNRVHFFIQDSTNANVYKRTLGSAYNLETMPAAFDTGVFGWETLEQRGYYATVDDSVALPYFDTSNTISRANILTASDAPTVIVDPDVTTAVSVLNSPIRFAASMAIENDLLVNTFIDTSNDIYTQTKSATWSNPTQQIVASASAVYTTIYTRGANQLLGIVYHDTDPKYSEITLSTSNVATLSLPNGLMLGRCGR